MEIDVTGLMNRREEMCNYSASQAELGPDAGAITWDNAMDRAAVPPPLLPLEGEAEFRMYLREFGAWGDEEIDGWSSQELNALLVQLVAGDIRERECYLPDRLEEYEQNHGGQLFGGDDGRWYYYIGT